MQKINVVYFKTIEGSFRYDCHFSYHENEMEPGNSLIDVCKHTQIDQSID